MNTREKLQQTRKQLELNNRHTEWYGEPNSPQLVLHNTHREMMNKYYNSKIQLLTDQAILELIQKRLASIDYNVTLDGEKIANAVVQRFSSGLSNTKL